MQEKMFAEARREMEKEIADAGLGSGYNGSFGQQSSSYFMDEAQRRQLMEQRINKTAEALTTQFMAEQTNSMNNSSSTNSNSSKSSTSRNSNSDDQDNGNSSQRP